MKLMKPLLLGVLINVMSSHGCCLRSVPTFNIIDARGQTIGKIKLVPELTRQSMRDQILASVATSIPQIEGEPNVSIKHGSDTYLDLNRDLGLRLTKPQIAFLDLNASQLKTEVLVRLIAIMEFY